MSDSKEIVAIFKELSNNDDMKKDISLFKTDLDSLNEEDITKLINNNMFSYLLKTLKNNLKHHEKIINTDSTNIAESEVYKSNNELIKTIFELWGKDGF